MLICSCGAVLVSNGEVWYCPYSSDKNYHPAKPVEISDKRMTTQSGIEHNRGRKVGRLV